MRTSIATDSHPTSPLTDREFIVIASDAESQVLLREVIPGKRVNARVTAFGAFASWVAVIRAKRDPLALVG